MLRASAHHTGRAVELSAIVHPDRISRLMAGGELIEFATALIRAAAVAGTFQMMNRVVDATGVPVGPSLRALGSEIGLAP